MDVLYRQQLVPLYKTLGSGCALRHGLVLGHGAFAMTRALDPRRTRPSRTVDCMGMDSYQLFRHLQTYGDMLGIVALKGARALAF